jgi:hypothetical protein
MIIRQSWKCSLLLKFLEDPRVHPTFHVSLLKKKIRKKKVSVEPQLSLFWEGLAHPKLEEILG